MCYEVLESKQIAMYYVNSIFFQKNYYSTFKEVFLKDISLRVFLGVKYGTKILIRKSKSQGDTFSFSEKLNAVFH